MLPDGAEENPFSFPVCVQCIGGQDCHVGLVSCLCLFPEMEVLSSGWFET